MKGMKSFGAALVCASILAVLGSAASAANYIYWDPNGTTAGAGSGGIADGTWSNTSTIKVWTLDSTGASATIAYASSQAFRDFVFSAGSDATGSSSITLGSSPTVNSITVEEGNVTFIKGAGTSVTLKAGTGSDSTMTGKVIVGAGLTFTNNMQVGSTSAALIKEGDGTWVQAATCASTLGLTINGGTVVFAAGVNAHLGSGAYTINNGGALIHNSNSIITSAITINSGTVGGTGYYRNLTIGANAIVAPGDVGSVGTHLVDVGYGGIETWGSGGTYAWQLLDNSLTAGDGWDLVNAYDRTDTQTGTGVLAIAATSADPFTIALESLSSVGVQGESLDWDANVDHQWLIATSAHGITGWDVADGEASSLFAVDATNFVGTAADAEWSVSKVGNDVYLNYTIPEPATIGLIVLGGLSLLARRRSGR